MRIRARAKGIEELARKLSPEQYERAVAPVVEKHTRLQANEAADRAPVETGLLSGSIQSSPRQLSKLRWQYGSNVEYARRQEYEHKTKKGFIRKTAFEGRHKFYGDVRNAVRKAIRG